MAGERFRIYRPFANRQSPYTDARRGGLFHVAEGTVVPNHSCIVQVRITNALEHCERARVAGAQILSEPVDHVYGERQYNAQDFYGHRWDFTESVADVAPESWGGISVNL